MMSTRSSLSPSPWTAGLEIGLNFCVVWKAASCIDALEEGLATQHRRPLA